MRRTIVRLIVGKELRDLLRDRRTVLLILGLPAILYPFFGLTAYLFAVSLLSQETVIGIVGAEHLPAAGSRFPLLLSDGRISDELDDADSATGPVKVRLLAGDPEEALRNRQADVVLAVPEGLTAELAADRRPALTVFTREGDEKSKLAGQRLSGILKEWEEKLRQERFTRHGIPTEFEKVLTIKDPRADRTKRKKTADELRDTFARVFPFILMMWLVAGAMHPAVDMTAGEKERGTMETLLISPAERTEIVVGKFLATTLFAFVSVVWNVLWLTGSALLIGELLRFPIVNLIGLVSCVVLGLPLAMLFSAISVAIGVFAKSTKEGQYYLMPLFLLTMPLALWSLAPGVELNPGNCWVPVTGAMLLQQRLLSFSADPVPWEYFGPVLGSLAVWVVLALLFAVWQFRREGVLFRETAPPPGIGVFRRLFSRGTGDST